MFKPNTVQKILKQKRKEVKELRRGFKEEMIKAAAYSVGGEFRSVEVTARQQKLPMLMVELRTILFPEAEQLEGFHPLRVVRSLIDHGLRSGVVIATDSRFLGGDPAWPNLVKLNTELPIIQRDFFLDPVQLYQSKAIGVDGVILSTAYIESETLPSLINAAGEMGLEVFLEVDTPHLPKSVHPEDLCGIVLDTDVQTLRAQQENPWVSFPESLSSRLVKIIRTYPETFDEVQRIWETGFQGIILNNDLWRRENFVAQFQKIRNWCEDVSA